MSTLSYSHTLSVRNRQERMPCCSFRSHPTSSGSRWAVHNGVILERCVGKQPFVVKVASSSSSASSSYFSSAAAQVDAELSKFNFARDLLQRSACGHGRGGGSNGWGQNGAAGGARGDWRRRVKLVPTFRSEVDKVGKGLRLSRGKRGDHGNTEKTAALREGLSVLVQSRMEKGQGPVQSLLDIRAALGRRSAARPGARPGQPREETEEEEDPLWPLLQFAREAYRVSGGQCVVTAVKGVPVYDDERGEMTYHVTSLTVHSRERKYGRQDEGDTGIAVYQDWNSCFCRPGDIPRCVPRRPSAPDFSFFASSCRLPGGFNGVALDNGAVCPPSYFSSPARPALDNSPVSPPPSVSSSARLGLDNSPVPPTPPFTNSARVSLNKSPVPPTSSSLSSRAEAASRRFQVVPVTAKGPAASHHHEPLSALLNQLLDSSSDMHSSVSIAQLLGEYPQLRLNLPESLLMALLGPAPSYSTFNAHDFDA